MPENTISCVPSPVFVVTIYELLSEAEKEGEEKLLKSVSYDYDGFSLSELALLSKDDAQAMDEFLLRVQPLVIMTAKSFVIQKNYLDFNEVFIRVEKTAIAAARIFNPSKGTILHLLRTMMKRTLTFYWRDTAIAYERSRRNFGTRVDVESDSFLSDSVVAAEGESPAAISARLDLERFLSSFAIGDRRIMTLWFSSYTFKEIATSLSLPVSTISYRFYLCLNRLKKSYFSHLA
jgi:hypothetical protein